MSLLQLQIVVALLTIGSGSIMGSPAQENNTYIMLSPKEFRPGMTFSIKVSILKSTSVVTVVASILSSTKLIALSTESFTAGQTGNLDLMIPYSKAVVQESYYLSVNGSGGLTFSEKSYISFREKGFSLNIQTDKGIYKPGQTVRMRIFGLLPDLKVYTDKMTIDITDPNNNKMSHWKDVQDASGVIKKEFPLSTQPVMGIWKIQVTAKGQKYERPFEVKKYVLPKFKVTVVLPPYVTKKSIAQDLRGSIICKYTYGKGVEGPADVYIYFRYRKNHVYKPANTQNIPVKGTGSFSFTQKEIQELYKKAYPWGSDSSLYMRGWPTLVVNATVREGLTGKFASAEAEVRFYQSDVKLEFPSFNPSTFKPGLKFDAILKVSQPDGLPILPARLNEIKITVRRKYRWGGPEMFDAYTPGSNGIIVIKIDVPSNASIVNLQAKYKVDDKNDVVKSFTANKAKSPSSSYIQLQTSTSSVKAGENIHLSLKSSFPLSSIYYLVMGRGSIRHNGGKQIAANARTASFSLTATSIMAPSAQVVVYTIRKDGEVVVDSLTVTIEDPFENKVTLAFGRNSSRPGDQVNLVAKATPGSHVSFRVIDQSVLLMKKDNDVTCNMILSDIQGYSNTGYPWWNWEWFGGPRRSRRTIMPFPVSGQDAKSVFQNSGLLVLSNCLIYSHYQERLYPIMYAESAGGDTFMRKSGAPNLGGPQPLAEVKRVRSLFPETWIWSDKEASSSGEVEIVTSVPDTITSWVASAFAISPSTGFGVACDRAKLQVFQPFFVSLDLPYSVTRGEEVAIKTLVFNYLKHPQEVTITLRASDDWNVINEFSPRGIKDNARDISHVVTVPANEGKAVAFPITLNKIGTIPIVVQAQSVMAADAVRRNLIVEPEGVEQEYSYTVLIDLNTTSSFSKSLELAVPKGAVEGSSYAKVTVLGDILGSSFSNLDNLLRMPYGCGEQNMVNFAPNIFILKYLTAVKQLTPAIRSKAENFMIKGYQREQTYRHRDGSYSAFGERDGQGSMWLTAFVVKSFAQARNYIFIDEKSLEGSILWITNKQNKDGSFPVVGAVHSSYLKGGLKGTFALTAFVVIALAEAKSKSPRVQLAQAEAVKYLEKNLASATTGSDAYSLAICTYALALTRSASATSARKALMRMAVSGDGTRHWTDGKSADVSPYRPYYRPRSADIEITAYALLAIKQSNDLQLGLPVVRWLSQQRNSLGGYSSTQDTVLGIQAMSEFAAMIYSPKMDYTVKLTNSADKAFTKTFKVNTTNSLVLQQVQIPKVEGTLKIDATGHGIGIVQVSVSYHVLKPPTESKFDFKIEVLSEGSYKVETQACAKWLGEGDKSNMAVMELGVFSGFDPDTESVDKLLANEGLLLKRVDNENRKTVLYFDSIFKQKLTCVNIKYQRSNPTGKSKPIPAVVYDYYSPEHRATALYMSKRGNVSVCRVCPGCIQCDHTIIGPTVAEVRGSAASLPTGSCLAVLVTMVTLALMLR